MIRRVPLALAVVLSALLVLGACGTTEPAGGAPPPGDPAAGGAPITVTDARDRQITIPGPATRVVGLEWGPIEHMVNLGVMPVGAADAQGYSDWVSVAPLDPSVQDVGLRGEPSVDAVAALGPDLIVGVDSLTETTLAQLEAIAPVVLVPDNDPADPIGGLGRTVTMMGQLLDREEQAAQSVAAMETALDDAAARLAPVAGQRYVFADANATGGQVAVRTFTDASLLGAVTTRLGLVNAWPGVGDSAYGLAQTDVEGLTAVGDANFLYILNDDSGGDVFVNQLGGNPLWESLPFVAQGRVNRLPDGIWAFGGTTSMTRYAESVVAALGS